MNVIFPYCLLGCSKPTNKGFLFIGLNLECIICFISVRIFFCFITWNAPVGIWPQNTVRPFAWIHCVSYRTKVLPVAGGCCHTRCIAFMQYGIQCTTHCIARMQYIPLCRTAIQHVWHCAYVDDIAFMSYATCGRQAIHLTWQCFNACPHALCQE